MKAIGLTEFGGPGVLPVVELPSRVRAGPHFCLGAPLARVEAAVVFQEMGPLLPRLALGNPDVTWRTGDMSDRCVTELKASWTGPA